MDKIHESREYLKSFDGMRFYHNYIDRELAGDFCVDIVKIIKELQEDDEKSCKGCTHLYNNDRHCTLSHNHCIRKAEDYYEKLKEE